MTRTQKVGRAVVWLSGIVLVFAAVFFLARLAQESEVVSDFVASYGYLGVFIVSLVSGLNFVVPVPAVSFFPLFLEGGLDFWIIIVVMTIGMTLADMVAYALGHFGREVAAESRETKMTQYLTKWRERYVYAPYVVLFLYASFAPLPNELIVAPMGFIGYRVAALFPIVLLGNVVFNVATAFGTVSIFNALL